MPGDTATLAWVSRSLEKASEPSSANGLGNGAHANIEAAGTGISQPAAAIPSINTSRRS